MALMGALITEHVLLKPGISKEQVKSLALVDLIYLISAGIVLITGLLRWFLVDVKGAEFFTKNPLFHIKVTLFVVIVIISIFPTIKFLKWRKEAKQNDSIAIADKDIKKQLMLIRIELLLVAIIPLLAVMVAGGIRM
jgi:putative membrane protein